MEGRETKPPPPNPAMPYREDCWSEGATAALIEAWGDRYIELNRGNLRQKHWQEVADAVNSRRGAARRPARTDVQCKNRIDTLKKKYKTEKAKIADGALDSQWPFYSRLDALIGDTFPAKKPPPPHPPSPPLALPLTFHRKGSPLPAAAVAAVAAAAAARPMDSKEKRPAATALPVDDAFFRRNYSAAAAAAAERESESSSRSSVERSRSRSSRERFSRGWKRRREGYGEGFRQLARAIVRLAEIYEKIEEEKQQQMIDLEKQRMEFAKGLEFQRMQIFVDSQVQLEKIKRSKRVDAESYLS